MYYEINVSLHGKHFFATDKRSATDSLSMIKIYAVFEQKFPITEGYDISVNLNPEVFEGVDINAYKETCPERFAPDLVTLLKNRTLTEDNINLFGNHYRYVNHTDKLMTTGFATKDALKRHTNDIRFDAGTIKLMKERYTKELKK